jgi:hypothetical protein
MVAALQNQIMFPVDKLQHLLVHQTRWALSSRTIVLILF